MASADSAVLDDFLNAFTSKVDSGFGLISGDVSAVFGTLVVISVGLTAVLWAIDESQNVTAAFVRKILLVGFFAWLINSWQSLALSVVDGFAALGLKAGSGSLSLGDFLASPTKIVGLGFTDAFALIAYIGQLSQQGLGFGFFNHFDVILVAAVAAIGIILAFIVLGVELAITLIEFHIVTLIAFVTVPFGVLAQTAFMSERAIGYVVSVGIKLMALALVVSIGEGVFQSYTVSAQPTVPEECGLLLASVIMMMLALKIPGIAGALISGGPQLSAGSAAAGAAGVAAGVGGALLAGRVASGMVSKGVADGLAGSAGKVAAAEAASSALPSSFGSAASCAAAGESSTASAGAGDGDSDNSAHPAAPEAGEWLRALSRAPVQTLVSAGFRAASAGFSAGSAPAEAADATSPGEGSPAAEEAQSAAGLAMRPASLKTASQRAAGAARAEHASQSAAGMAPKIHPNPEDDLAIPAEGESS